MAITEREGGGERERERCTVRRHEPKENSGRSRELSGVGGALGDWEGPESPAEEPVGSRKSERRNFRKPDIC